MSLSPIVSLSNGSIARVIDYSSVMRDVVAKPRDAYRKFRNMGFGTRDAQFNMAVNVCVATTKTEIPADVRAQAAMYAPQLVATMRDSVRRMSRHMTAGSLDTSKLVRLARPSSPAQFERDAATAFRARVNKPVEAPLKIAIVADMNWDIRRNNPEYTTRVGLLAFILSDAATCAGLQVAAYGARGKLNQTHELFGRDNASGAVLLSTITAYGKRIDPVDFASHTGPDAYIAGFRLSAPNGATSYDGTGGPTFAQEHDKATFIIGLGNFDDADKCDVVLSTDATIAQCVAQVHAALKARNAKAAA